MNADTLKVLKDQLIAVEPDIAVLQQGSGSANAANSITALHSVLVQLLHSVTPPPSPQPEHHPFLNPAPVPAPSPEIAITAATDVPASVNA